MSNGSTFEALISERTREFTGREWVFERIDAWLEEKAEPVFFLTGGPGSGKTAVAARLVQITGGIISTHNTPHLANQPLYFYTFCQAGSEELDPLRFVTKLALALAKRFDEYAQALANLGDQRNIIVNQTARQVASGGEMTGVVIQSLTITDLSARLAFNRTIREPLLKLIQNGFDSPILILVDALDEALTYHKEENLVTLLHHILDKPQELPPNMRFILTGRWDERLLHQLPSPTLHLLDNAPDDLYDVRRYAHRRLAELEVQRREALAERIAVTGKGNFLYARYVLDDLLPRLTLEIDVSTVSLPPALRNIYQEFLDRELAGTTEAWQEKYGLLVSILAVARGNGLTRDQLAGMVNLEDVEADKILTPIRQYLAYESSLGPFRIYHQSFREFLLSLDDGSIRVYPAQAQRTIAGFFWEEWEGAWAECDEEYPLRHLPFHMQQAGNDAKRRRSRQAWVDRLRALLLDFGWLQAKLTLTEINSLLNDFSFVATDNRHDYLRLIKGAIRLSAHVLVEDKEQLSSQLYGRLLPLSQPEIVSLRKQITKQTHHPWLKLQTPTMIPPGGALIRTLAGHTKEVTSVALSEDGHTLVTGSEDRIIRLWDVDTEQMLRRFEGHAKPVWAVALSKDGRILVSGAKDNTICLWDVGTGDELQRFEGHAKPVTSVALSEDNSVLVSGSLDKTVRLWDVGTGHERWCSEDDDIGWVYWVALSANGRLVSGSEDSVVRLWDVDTGEVLYRFEGHKSRVLSVSLSKNGRILASGSADKTILLWNVDTGRVRRRLEGHNSGVLSVALSADGHTLVSGSWGHTVRLWNADKGEVLHPFEGHTEWVSTVALSGNGRAIFSGFRDKTACLWITNTDHKLPRFVGHAGWVYSVALSKDGSTLVSGSGDRTVRLWDVETGDQEWHSERHSGLVYSVALCADNHTVIFGFSGSSDIHLWDINTNQELKFKGHGARVLSMALSAYESILVSGSEDKTVRSWDMKTGQQLWCFEGHTESVNSVALSVSEDSRTLASGSEDKTIRLWDMDTGQQLQCFEGHTKPVTSVALSGDGRKLVSGSEDNLIFWWDMKTGRVRQRFEGHKNKVLSVALSADGRKLVSGSNDHTVRLWDVGTGQQIAIWTGNGVVLSCDISNNGRTIVVGDADYRVHIFTLANYE